MKDLNKLHFEASQVRDFRNICEHLERLAKECKNTLWESTGDDLSSIVRENIESLNFSEELTDSREDRSTRAGILCDDREKFLRFREATGIMIKSRGAGEEVENLCEQLEDSLITLCSLMAKVLHQSKAPLPKDEDLRDLEEKLDQKTKKFLESFEEAALENTNGNRIDHDESTVDEVRNYIITKTLSETLSWFKIDFDHLTKE